MSFYNKLTPIVKPAATANRHVHAAVCTPALSSPPPSLPPLPVLAAPVFNAVGAGDTVRVRTPVWQKWSKKRHDETVTTVVYADDGPVFDFVGS